MEPSPSLTLYSVINPVPSVLKIFGISIVGETGILFTSTTLPVFPIYGPQSIFTCCPIFILVLYHKKGGLKITHGRWWWCVYWRINKVFLSLDFA